MTTKEKVSELENKLAVDSLTVEFKGRTFQVYPWLKGRLFHKIITGQETLQKRNIKLYWQQFTSIFYGLHNVFGRYKIWVFTNSVERRAIEGKYFDKLFDFIGNDSGYKTLVIELRLFSIYPNRKVASKYAMSKSFFMLFETLYAKLRLRNVKVSDLQLLNDINAAVTGGVNSKELIQKYLSQYQMMKFWLKILPNPKVVMLSVGYTNFGYIRAFKEKGIKVIEVQHGIISQNHHAYYYLKNFDSVQFPDFIFTTGEKELEVFNADNKFPTENVIPVGSFIIDYYASHHKVKNDDGVPSVLFTLQDGVMGTKFINFILELNKLAGEKLNIIVQPRRSGKDFYLAQNSEVKQLFFSNKDFYSSVVTADIHSTVYSTTAIESLSLGVPNILVNIDNQSKEQLLEALSENPYTIVVESPDEFIQAVSKLVSSDRDKVMNSNNRNIKSNYRVNIKKVLKDLMD